MACQMASGNGPWRAAEVISQSMKRSRGSSMVSFSDRQSFGTSFEHLQAVHRRRQHVRVAADYPDSKPDASPYLGDLGYHPLEDISNFEKKKNIDLTDRRLSDAEVARTLAQENETAILFASLREDRDHVFGTELEYIIDEYGDFYFQIDDDSEFLTTLNNARTPMNVAIGYESIEDWITEQQEGLEESTLEVREDDSSDDEDEEREENWTILTADGTEYALEGMMEEEKESQEEESVGNWSGLDTLGNVHPLEFATALSLSASADNRENFEKPSQSLKVVAEIHRLSGEEEEYVQRLCQNRFSGEEDEDDKGQQEDLSTSSSSWLTNNIMTLDADVEENNEDGEAGTSFYKLDIQSIHVVSYFGESTVDKFEFQTTKPDILARAGPEIIDRLNARGKVFEEALKLVCLQRKGLEIEEAMLLQIDSLGMDLRIHCGREVKTIRVSFSQRATSVEHAEQLLNQLLFPQVPPRGPRKKPRSWFQGKSV